MSLLPLPPPLSGAYIAYGPLMDMSATQGAVVHGQHMTQPVIMQHLKAFLPPRKPPSRYDMMFSCAPTTHSNAQDVNTSVLHRRRADKRTLPPLVRRHVE